MDKKSLLIFGLIIGLSLAPPSSSNSSSKKAKVEDPIDNKTANSGIVSSSNSSGSTIPQKDDHQKKPAKDKSKNNENISPPEKKDVKPPKDKKTTTNNCRVSDCVLCINSKTSRCMECSHGFVLRKFKARYGKRRRYDICSSEKTYGIYFVIVILPTLILFGVYLYCSLADPSFEHMLQEKEVELRRKEEYQSHLSKLKQKGEMDAYFEPDQEHLGLIEEEDSLFGQGISLDDDEESESEDQQSSETDDSVISEEEKELGINEIAALERLRKMTYGN